MTARTIYWLACDAPHCPTTTVVEKIADVPDGWRRINSTDHLADWQPGQRRTATGRRYTDKRSRWDISAAAITLHVCPDHPTVFDGHLPLTEAGIADRKTGDRNVSVTCSCGALGGLVRDMFLVERLPRPNGLVERTWWQHLPEELREYATRGRMEVAA